MTKAARRAYFNRFNKAHVKAENKAYKAILTWLKTVETTEAEAVADMFKADDLKAIFLENYAESGAMFRAFLLENFQKTVEKRGVIDAMLSVGIAAARFQSVMATFAGLMAAERVTGICDNLRGLLRNVIEAAIGQNLSKAETAKEIRKNWGAVSKSRARLIARTETTTVAGFAQMETAKEFSIELDKVWISARDGRTRDDHRANDGQRVKYEDDFSVGGVAMKQPGDPRGGAKNCCNCRCTVAFVARKEFGPLR